MMVEPLTADELDALDPGVRDLVVWLRSHGFNTTDSGDGVTKRAAGNTDALDVPHVFMRVDLSVHLRAEALRLQYLLGLFAHLTPQPGRIEASYDPANGIAILMLMGVSDDDLRRLE